MSRTRRNRDVAPVGSWFQRMYPIRPELHVQVYTQIKVAQSRGPHTVLRVAWAANIIWYERHNYEINAQLPLCALLNNIGFCLVFKSAPGANEQVLQGGALECNPKSADVWSVWKVPASSWRPELLVASAKMVCISSQFRASSETSRRAWETRPASVHTK